MVAMDSQGLVYRMECYSRLLWLRMELVALLGVESAYVRYLSQLARRYAE
jgi:Tfp pilus assembly protein PilF